MIKVVKVNWGPCGAVRNHVPIYSDKSKLKKLRAKSRFFSFAHHTSVKMTFWLQTLVVFGAELLPSAPHDSAPAPSSCCSTPSPSPRSPPARSSPRPPSPTYSRTPSCWASTGSSRRGPRCRGSPRSPRRSPHRSCPPSGSVWPASGSFSPRSVR